MMYQEDYNKYIAKILSQIKEAKEKKYIDYVLQQDLTKTLKEFEHEVSEDLRDDIWCEFEEKYCSYLPDSI